MTDIKVNIGKGYGVSIGRGLLDRCGEIAASAAGACRLAVVTDENIAPLYLRRVLRSFEAAGFETESLVLPAGERTKNLNTLAEILEFFAARGLGRGDMAAALGGGVAGDLTGFAAGVYLRGIRYIQLPTTLLAALDSSVGGKTAVNLAAGKNLAGLFVQPQAVICDTEAFATLTREALACGRAEALKTGILAGEELFALVSADAGAEAAVAGSVRFKARLAEADERDTGARRLLNLGHTAGHAIEKLSGYAVQHGLAVAMGTALIARASRGLGLCSAECASRIIGALERSGLPVKTPFSAAELARAAGTDKKRDRGDLALVLIRDIGDCVVKKVPLGELEEIFRLGTE